MNAQREWFDTDYYAVLGVDRGADHRAITKAYRKLARELHPDVNPDPSSLERFKEVTAAYEVLSDPKKKDKYDQFGEDGLKDGFGGGGPGMDPHDIFSQFFGGAGGGMPGGMGGGFGGMPGHGHGGQSSRAPRKKAEPIEQVLRLTLEEMYYGVQKNLKLTRTVLRGGGEQRISETLSIDVKPGWKKGTKITFQEKGDETPGAVAADIVFVIEEKKHPQFERDGNDLIKTVVVDLHEALLGTKVFITTLDGKSVNVDVPEIVDPKHVKVLVGEGMPLSKSPAARGDMKIKFDIRFPKELSAEQRATLKSVLESAKY